LSLHRDRPVPCSGGGNRGLFDDPDEVTFEIAFDHRDRGCSVRGAVIIVLPRYDTGMTSAGIAQNRVAIFVFDEVEVLDLRVRSRYSR